jgi:hypothetical protein
MATNYAIIFRIKNKEPINMNQIEIDKRVEAEEEQYPHLKDIQYYDVSNDVTTITGKAKATINKKLRDPKVIEQLGNDLIESKNDRGKKKYLLTLNGVRKMVAIFEKVDYKSTSEMTVAELQKFTREEDTNPIQDFKEFLVKESGKNWKKFVEEFENVVEPEILRLKQRNHTIAELKEINQFLSEECNHQQGYIEQQKKVIENLELARDLLLKQNDILDSIIQKKNTNK